MKTNTNSSAINPAANCSAILGGFNNNANHPFSAVFGNGITTVAANTMHLNNLWVCGGPAVGATTATFRNLPTMPGGASGTLWVDAGNFVKINP
jgi:hypothetical protein